KIVAALHPQDVVAELDAVRASVDLHGVAGGLIDRVIHDLGGWIVLTRCGAADQQADTGVRVDEVIAIETGWQKEESPIGLSTDRVDVYDIALNRCPAQDAG